VSARRGILIVDDEAILLLAIRQELRLALGAGYVFETAMSAQAGLDAIEDLSRKGVEVALIISDWLMPGMRGDEFLKIVRIGHPEVKLVMLSGHAEAEQMQNLAAEVQLFASLGKPYRKNELSEIAKRALIA
jgi:DNA-binding NtrC family response regulator